MWLKTTYADQASHVKWTALTVTVFDGGSTYPDPDPTLELANLVPFRWLHDIDDPVCDCSRLKWDAPSTTLTATVNVGDNETKTFTLPVATVNEASRTASREIAVCYEEGDSCAESYTLSLELSDGRPVGSSGFITAGIGAKEVDVGPVAPEHYGTWTIVVTQTTANGNDPVFDAITITVDCTIRDIALASPAPAEQYSYKISDPTLEIDLSELQYVQTPNCGKSVTKSFAWTYSPDAPIQASPIEAGAAAVAGQRSKIRQ